jgi:hypothetical protein
MTNGVWPLMLGEYQISTGNAIALSAEIFSLGTNFSTVFSADELVAGAATRALASDWVAASVHRGVGEFNSHFALSESRATVGLLSSHQVKPRPINDFIIVSSS